MSKNKVIEILLAHRSIRKYTDEDIDIETINTIIRAGQQAAFAYQTYSVILSRQKRKNPFKAPGITDDLCRFVQI
ncbi:MAG: nitroreductase family protein [Thermoplasmata archaeon]|nr:nitroreductase family protein [Thermoplasmata archaeon]